MHKISIAVFVLMLGAVMTANIGCMVCGEGLTEKIAEKAMEKAVEAGSGGKAKIDVGGKVDMSGLPGYLHYPGVTAKGKFSMSGGSGEGRGTVWALETADPQQKVIDWYKKSLEGKGWKQGATMETGEGMMLMYAGPDEKEVATIVLSAEDGKTVIALTHGTN